MKKFINLVALLFIMLNCNAQVATDSNGQKVYKGNIAVLTKAYSSSFYNGQFILGDNKDLSSNIEIGLQTFMTKFLLEEGFQIVNRDNEAFEQVYKILEETKSEDYIDGYRAEAKGQGAEWFIYVEHIYFNHNSEYIVSSTSIRMINVQNNYSFQSRWSHSYDSFEEANLNIASDIQQDKLAIREKIRSWFPTTFAVSAIKGKKALLFATTPVGAIASNDKLYLYEYSSLPGAIEGYNMNFDVLELLSATEGKDLSIENGLLSVKSKKNIANPSSTIAILSNLKTSLNSEARYPVTYESLPYIETDIYGYMKKEINGSILAAIGRIEQFSMCERELISDIKQERDLQKGEEFIDGKTVNQGLSVGAQYLIKVSNLDLNPYDYIAEFQLEVYDIATNTLMKSFPIKCHLSKVEDFIYYNLNNVLVFKCKISSSTNKEIEILSQLPIDAEKGDKFTLYAQKAYTDPITNKISYNRVAVAELSYLSYSGMKHKLKVNKILEKDLFENYDVHDFTFARKLEEPKPEKKKKPIDASDIINGLVKIGFQ